MKHLLRSETTIAARDHLEPSLIPDVDTSSPCLRNVRLVQLALLLSVCLAYANSFHNGFHFDDFHTVVDNPAIRSTANIPHFFTDATTFSVLPANRTYRPVVSASLAVDYALAKGYDPRWFHVATFFLFLSLLLLLQRLYLLLMDAAYSSPHNFWLSCMAAAWFGLHPAVAETINYIVQRGDLYCTLGCVGSLLIFARHPGLRRFGLYLLPLILALLSKPPAAIFPALLFAFVFLFEPAQHRLRAAALAAAPSFAVTGLMLWLQSVMTPRTFLHSTLSATAYRITQPYVWLRYAQQLLLPLHLNVDSDLAPLHRGDPRLLAGFGFLLLLLGLIFYTARQKRLFPITFGLIWFLLTQLPTSAYVLSEVENDHRMFFSFAGLMVAVVWALGLLYGHFVGSVGSHARAAVAASVILVLACYGYGVHRRNQVWLNEETLWLDDVQKCPHNGRGLMIYGLTQMNKGSYTLALDYFTRALAFAPGYATLQINLGIVEGALADQDAAAASSTFAEAHFLRALALDPDDDAAHAFYGRWLREHGRTAEAVQQLQTAVALNPQRPMQHDELILAYGAAGDLQAALQAARRTLDLIPGDDLAQQTLTHPPAPGAAFWINLSLAQYQAGHYPEAAASAARALQLDPNSPEAWNNLGAARAQLRQWPGAIEADRRALALRPAFELARNNLAWATAQQRDESTRKAPASAARSANAKVRSRP